MERTAWTEERLDDLAEAVRSGFARVDQDIRELRASVDRVQETMLQVQQTMLRVQQTMIWVGGSMMLGIVGILATILARGA